MKGSPTHPSSPGELGRDSYLSDEDSTNFLVIPAEGGEELMVSRETVVIVGAAAWVGKGRAMRAPMYLNTASNGHLLRAAFCQTGLPDQMKTSSPPTFSNLSPDPQISFPLLLTFPILSPENKLSSPFSFPSPRLRLPGGQALPYKCDPFLLCPPPHSLDTLYD